MTGYKIIVSVSGGTVQDVQFSPSPITRVEIRDYDIEGTDDSDTLQRGYEMEVYTP